MNACTRFPTMARLEQPGPTILLMYNGQDPGCAALLAGCELVALPGLSRGLGGPAAWRRAKRVGTATTGSLIGACTVVMRVHGAPARA
jgi:hypothetical protein